MRRLGLRNRVAVPLFALLLSNGSAMKVLAAGGEGDAIRSITVTDREIARTPVSVAIGLEDVNHEIYGGIYSQMIFGEAFAEPQRSPGISGMWRATTAGAGTSFALVGASPFKGRQSQRILGTGSGVWSGIENRGLNRQGLSVLRGRSYSGRIVLRSDRDAVVRVSLQSADGATTHVEQLVSVSAGSWRRIEIALTPRASDPHARFAIEVRSRVVLDVGYAFLQPGSWGRFKGLPVRADVAHAMLGQGLKAIRFGGCANGGCGDVGEYKWKSMIGDPADRPVTRGFWYPYESNGFAIFEFLQLGEALGIEAVPSLNIDETADDLRDLMEYLYGATNTPWGARRARDGHPLPYRVKRLELGNEEAVDDAYFAKFERLASAIWKYDRSIRLVVGDFQFEDEIRDPYRFTGGKKISSLAAHRRILELAVKWDAAVDFDVHIWSRRVGNAKQATGQGGIDSQVRALDSYAAALKAIAPKDARFKIVVFELNADAHDLTRALANAYSIGALQKRPYIDVISSANGLQVEGQNDNGWDQGLIFMDQAKVWQQPPYYAHQIIASSLRAQVLETKVEGEGDEGRVEATAFGDAAGVSLNVVNASDEPIRYRVRIGAWAAGRKAEVVSLGDDRGTAVNTATNPTNIVPERSSVDVGSTGAVDYVFPARSLVSFRIGR